MNTYLLGLKLGLSKQARDIAIPSDTLHGVGAAAGFGLSGLLSAMYLYRRSQAAKDEGRKMSLGEKLLPLPFMALATGAGYRGGPGMAELLGGKTVTKQSQAYGQVVNRAVKGIFKPLKQQQKHDPMGPLTDALNHMQDADATTNQRQDAGDFAKKKDRKTPTSVAAGY